MTLLTGQPVWQKGYAAIHTATGLLVELLLLGTSLINLKPIVDAFENRPAVRAVSRVYSRKPVSVAHGFLACSFATGNSVWRRAYAIPAPALTASVVFSGQDAFVLVREDLNEVLEYFRPVFEQAQCERAMPVNATCLCSKIFEKLRRLSGSKPAGSKSTPVLLQRTRSKFAFVGRRHRQHRRSCRQQNFARLFPEPRRCRLSYIHIHGRRPFDHGCRAGIANRETFAGHAVEKCFTAGRTIQDDVADNDVVLR